VKKKGTLSILENIRKKMQKIEDDDSVELDGEFEYIDSDSKSQSKKTADDIVDDIKKKNHLEDIDLGSNAVSKDKSGKSNSADSGKEQDKPIDKNSDAENSDAEDDFGLDMEDSASDDLDIDDEFLNEDQEDSHEDIDLDSTLAKVEKDVKQEDAKKVEDSKAEPKKVEKEQKLETDDELIDDLDLDDLDHHDELTDDLEDLDIEDHHDEDELEEDHDEDKSEDHHEDDVEESHDEDKSEEDHHEDDADLDNELDDLDHHDELTDDLEDLDIEDHHDEDELEEDHDDEDIDDLLDEEGDDSGLVDTDISGLNKDNLVSKKVAEQAVKSIKNFSQMAASSEGRQSLATDSDSKSGGTMEDVVMNMLEPKLEEWLNKNLPAIVEDVVRQEIKKLVPKK
jgi:cell pole-organizing protein PopZ